MGKPEVFDSDRNKYLRLRDEVECLFLFRIPFFLKVEAAFAGEFAGNGLGNFLRETDPLGRIVDHGRPSDRLHDAEVQIREDDYGEQRESFREKIQTSSYMGVTGHFCKRRD